MDSLGVEELMPINDWVDLAVYGEENELIYHQKHRITKSMTELEILVNQQPIKVVIDPNYLQIDKDRKDNERDFWMK